MHSKSMRTFYTIWGGQLISLIGSGLTAFALGVWVVEETGRATPFSIILLINILPRLVLSPVAGALVDRWDRRRVMIGADTAAALATGFAALMLYLGDFQIWYIYVIAFVASLAGAFQEPAYTAAVTMIVPKEKLPKASGLMQMSQAVELLIAPVLGGVLFGLIGLRGVMTIDLITFFFAVGSLLLVHIPQPEVTPESEANKGTLWQESIYGFRYIAQRPGLLAMLIFFAMVNLALNFSAVLIVPMVLGFASAATLGLIQAASGVGMLAGSVLMSSWGGPRRKMHGVYGAIALMGAAFVVIGLRPSPWLVGLGFFLVMLPLPLGSGLAQVIWQTKVAPDVQGRVFAVRGMMSRMLMPIAYILGGTLADNVFGPLMAPGGGLAEVLGPIIGVGAGRGAALMMIGSGVTVVLVTAIAYAVPALRNVEDDLPDFEPVTQEEPEPAVAVPAT